MKSRTLVPIMLAMALVGLIPTTAMAASGTPKSPLVRGESASQILQATLKATTEKGSVHVTVAFGSGKTTGEVVQDSAVHSGKQTTAIGNERASILVIDNTTYISGNKSGMATFFGFPATEASTFAGHWISLKTGDPGYTTATEGITLTSALSGATPGAPLAEGRPTKIDGIMVDPIVGIGPAGQPQMVMFVAAKGDPLPIEVVTTSGSGKSQEAEIIRFSHWGEPVKVPVPTTAIPISAIPSSG